MKVKELLNNLKDLVIENPNLLEADVVYSSDDEGNIFSEIHFTPTVGHFSCTELEFTSKDSEDFEGEINAVCVN